MKPLNELLAIDLDEAKILFEALHHWYFKVQYKKKPKPELMEIDKLYQSLKSFINSFYDD